LTGTANWPVVVFVAAAGHWMGGSWFA